MALRERRQTKTGKYVNSVLLKGKSLLWKLVSELISSSFDRTFLIEGIESYPRELYQKNSILTENKIIQI